MNEEQFNAIFDDDKFVMTEGDDALNGLQIIAKYFPNKTVLQGANHDIIYSVNVWEIVEAGITEEDTLELRLLGWHLEDGYLAKFV